jgi:hypothetical protein
LRLVDSVVVKLARLVLGEGCLTACVIQQVLERVVPQAQQVSDERLRLPAQLAHERLKLGRCVTDQKNSASFERQESARRRAVDPDVFFECAMRKTVLFFVLFPRSALDWQASV